MYTMLSVCLNLGNFVFKAGKEGSDVSDTKLLQKCADQLQVKLGAAYVVHVVHVVLNIVLTPALRCERSQVDAKTLLEAVTFRTMGGGKLSTYKSPLEPPRATIARNSLVMHVYSLVFDWCVTVINEYISVYNAAYCTGVLDIFGFENFSVNSFPQVRLEHRMTCGVAGASPDLRRIPYPPD